MKMYDFVLLSVLAGFLMDALLGDPVWLLPHPVVVMGRLITVSEKVLLRAFPSTPRGEQAAGAVMAVFVPLVSAVTAWGILRLCLWVHPLLWFAVSTLMCWRCFAARCLQQEAAKVVRCLEREGLAAARTQVGMLVGRDTAQLSEEQVLRAAVETVAENTCDGVVAPLFWMVLAGPAGGFFYKAVNTMDSMVGYKNERYLWFGRWAARLDDAVNYLPARLTALSMIATAGLLGYDGKNALRIWRRDRRRHPSPNSAQGESACAGALGIQLGGDAVYFGTVHHKPTLGAPLRPIGRTDVGRSCKLMYAASLFCLVVLEGLGLMLGGLVLCF